MNRTLRRTWIACLIASLATVAVARGRGGDGSGGRAPADVAQRAVASADQSGGTAPTAPVCKKCASTGRLPCSEHPLTECQSEDDVLYCSVTAACAVCAGTGWVPCKDCVNEPARAALEAKKASLAKYAAGMAEFDKKMGRPLAKVETKHFQLVWDLERIKVEKKFLNQHEALHLYAKRLERLYADYAAQLKLTDKDFREKFRVFVWWLPKDHADASLAFCGMNSSGGVKKLGSQPAYSVCGNKNNFQDDDKLHRNLVHSVTHLILSSEGFPQWIGNIKGGWADEGLSHWFEDRYWGICDNYCFQEANSNVDFKSGRFKLAVRKLIEADKMPSVTEVFERNSDTLTLPEHAASLSYVDFFMTRDGGKFRELLVELKRKVPTREALKKIYGYGPLEFEAQWKAWVLATYPTK